MYKYSEQKLHNTIWHFSKMKLIKLIIAVIVCYVVSGLGQALHIYYKEGTLWYYNKYLVLVLCFILFLRKMKNRELNIEIPGLGLFLAFFCCVLIHGIYPADPLWNNVGYSILKVYILFILIINLFRNRSDYQILGIAFVFVGMILISITLVEYSKYYSIVTARAASRSVGFYIDTNTISYLAVLTYVICCYVFRDLNKFWKYFVILAVLFSVSYTVITNVSRVASALLIFSIIMLTEKRFFKISQSFNVILLSITVFVLIKTVGNFDYFISRLFSDTRYYMNEPRWDATVVAWNAFLDEPIWGKGYSTMLTPWGFNHTWYLCVIVAYGLIGFILLLAAVYRIFPLKTLLKSKYTFIFAIYLLVMLSFAPLIPIHSLVFAFLYHEKKAR